MTKPEAILLSSSDILSLPNIISSQIQAFRLKEYSTLILIFWKSLGRLLTPLRPWWWLRRPEIPALSPISTQWTIPRSQGGVIDQQRPIDYKYGDRLLPWRVGWGWMSWRLIHLDMWWGWWSKQQWYQWETQHNTRIRISFGIGMHFWLPWICNFWLGSVSDAYSSIFYIFWFELR